MQDRANAIEIKKATSKEWNREGVEIQFPIFSTSEDDDRKWKEVQENSAWMHPTVHKAAGSSKIIAIIALVEFRLLFRINKIKSQV